MNTTLITADSLFMGNTRTHQSYQAHQAVEAALRVRRSACAAYGRALATLDYTTPQEEREATLAALRQAITDAGRQLDTCLLALEELL